MRDAKGLGQFQKSSIWDKGKAELGIPAQLPVQSSQFNQQFLY